MSRYIDADALLKGYEDHELISTHLIWNAPSADVVEVRHGKWEWASCTYDRVPCEKEYICSCCHHKVITHGDGEPWEKYCSNCGAKMDKEQEHE